MKTFCLFILISSLSNPLIGQISKGSSILGGTIGVDIMDSKADKNLHFDASETKTNQFVLSPKYGFLLTDNFMIGVGMDYSYYFQKMIQIDQNNLPRENTTRMDTYLFSLFVRNYKSIGESFAIFLQSEIGDGQGKNTYKYSYIDANGQASEIKSKNTFTEFEIAIKPGFNYFISKKCVLEATVGALTYTFIHNKGTEITQSTKNSNFSAKFDMTTVKFGAYYFLNRH